MCNIKNTYFFLSILILFSYTSHGQESISRIEKLQFGQFNSTISLSGTSFGTEIWGRYSNNKYYHWCTVFENPAYISGERSPKIMFQLSPAQNFGLTRIMDLSTIFNSNVDEGIVSYKSENLLIGYPTINLKLKRPLNWPEGMFIFPIKKFTIGLLYHRSLSVSSSFDFIGNETSISTELSTGVASNKVILNNYLDAVNKFDYLCTSTSLILTQIHTKQFISGLQVERLFNEVYIAGNWNIQGSMLYNGKEYLFNDPETLWPTEIKQDFHGHFKGVGWKFNWGGTYVINSRWMLDGLISYATKVRLKGILVGNRNVIPALSLDALESGSDVDEILKAEELNPSQLTYTEKRDLDNYPEITQSMPSQIKFGLLYTTRNWGFYLSNRYYFNSYHFQYGTNYVELTPQYLLKLSINRNGLYTKLGAYLFEAYAPETQDFYINHGLLAVPLFSFGYCTKFSQQTIFSSTMQVLPIPGVNFGFQYYFK